jgi:COP9 signalosome complex subunit 7
MEQYCLLAKGARGLALVDLIQRVTSDPQVFAFGELLAIQNVKELENTEHSNSLTLLRLFSTGTWNDYTENSGSFPPLSPAQQVKLKQLTVVSIAESMKRVPYDHLMQQLGVTNVRQLEDLLISHCFHPGLIRGKLDQKQACMHVHQAVARDVRPKEVAPIIQGLQNWLETSRGVLAHLQQSMEAVQQAAQTSKARQAEMEAAIEEERKKLGALDRNGDLGMSDDGPGNLMDMMETETRSHAHPLRSKRRR